MKIHWLEKNKLQKIIKKKIKQTYSVLDIGCGIQPQSYFQPLVHICADPHLEYLDFLKNKKTLSSLNKTYIHADWKKALQIIPKKSVDSVFIQDVIEHIPKNTAQKFIKDTEKIAKQQIIIFTPLGFIKQEHEDGVDAWGMSGAKWQKHRSGWHPEDFDNSWEIYACKNYHKENNMGEKVKEFGAFYAIKNFNTIPISLGQRIQLNIHKIIDFIFMVGYKFVQIFK